MMSDLPKQDPSGPESSTRSEEGFDQGTGYEECCNVHEDSRQASIARIWQPQVDHKTEAMECLQCHGIFETRSKYKSKRKHFCKFLGVKLEKQPEIDVTSQSVAMTCSICRFVHFQTDSISTTFPNESISQSACRQSCKYKLTKLFCHKASVCSNMGGVGMLFGQFLFKHAAPLLGASLSSASCYTIVLIHTSTPGMKGKRNQFSKAAMIYCSISFLPTRPALSESISKKGELSLKQ